MYILAKIGRILTEWLELPETGRNLTRGGMDGITVSNYMPVRDIPTIPCGTE